MRVDVTFSTVKLRQSRYANAQRGARLCGVFIARLDSLLIFVVEEV